MARYQLRNNNNNLSHKNDVHPNSLEWSSILKGSEEVDIILSTILIYLIISII